MNKSMIILFVGALLFFQLHAEDTRDQVRDEILKSLDGVEKARQVTINELRETVRSIEAARGQRGDENETEKTIGTKIVESQALGTIAQSTATVEIAKVNAKEKMVNAIMKVEGLEFRKASSGKIENEKALATKKIVKAISSVEIAKAHAARSIMDATKKVEISKTKEKYKLVDDASALKVAMNISAVQIAKSVSAVEITQAVSNVKIAQALLDEDVELSIEEQYQDLTLDEIKSKAKADISTITARMEVLRAKALADVAQIVSFVKIAEAIKLQNKNEESINPNNKRLAYPQNFIRYKGR